MNRLIPRALGALLAASLLLLGSCGGGGGIGGANGTGGSVRLLNATPDFPTLDLYEGTDRIVSGTAASTLSDYADSAAEAFTFNLQSGGSGTVAATVSGTVEKRKHATVVAYTTGGALNAAFLTDEEGSPSSGSAKVRVFNAANTEAGAVDVYFVGTSCAALDASAVAATASDVTGLQTGYTQLGAAGGSGTAYHVCVTATGDKTDLRLDLPAFTLTDQQIVTLVLVKSRGGVLLNGLAVNQQGGLTATPNASARIRVAAGASAGGIVSGTVDGIPVGNTVSPDVGGYVLVPAGTLATALSINGSPAPFSGQSAPAGADLTLFVAGTPAAPAVSLLVDDNAPSTSTAKPVKIRLVNGFAGSGTVTLSVDGINVGNGAAYGTASAPALVAASSQASRLKATSSAGQLYLSEGNTLTAGSVYTVFLLGDAPTQLPATATGILHTDR